MSSIAAWENSKKATLEAELRKIEVVISEYHVYILVSTFGGN